MRIFFGGRCRGCFRWAGCLGSGIEGECWMRFFCVVFGWWTDIHVWEGLRILKSHDALVRDYCIESSSMAWS